MSGKSGDVTAVLEDWSNGDEQALAELMPLVYDELRRRAARYLRRERQDHTLQTTALVDEAFLRMIDQRRVNYRGSLHFVALAAEMMRRILIDHARSHRYAKRGAGAPKIPLDRAPDVSAEPAPDLLEVDEALTRLTEIDAQLGRIVELRFFGGMTSEEIAELLEISVPTVTRRWRMAKAWLCRYLTEGRIDGRGATPPCGATGSGGATDRSTANPEATEPRRTGAALFLSGPGGSQASAAAVPSPVFRLRTARRNVDSRTSRASSNRV